MKFFKSTLSIMFLFTTGSIFAARTPKTPQETVTQKTTQGTVTETGTVIQPQTYKTLLAKVKGMKKADVVDNNNALTPTFITFVQENTTASNLSDTETEALLQAGFNFHATLSGDQAKDKAALSSLSSQIRDAMSEEMEMPDLFGEAPEIKGDAGEALKRLQQQGPQTLKTAQTTLEKMREKDTKEAEEALKRIQGMGIQNFYDPATNLLDPAYLQKKIQALLVNKDNRAARLDALRVELFSTINTEWKKRGINVGTFKNKLNDQITNVYNNEIKRSKMQQTGKVLQSGTELTSPTRLAPIELGVIPTKGLTVEQLRKIQAQQPKIREYDLPSGKVTTQVIEPEEFEEVEL